MWIKSFLFVIFFSVLEGQLVAPNGFYVTKIPVHLLNDGTALDATTSSTTEFAPEPETTTEISTENMTEIVQKDEMPAVRATPYDMDICSKTSAISVCLDCSVITVCVGDEALTSKSCGGANPYCVESELGAYCSATPDPERVQCETNFKCTSEGLFPDPFNCRYFYDCDDKMKAIKYDCNPGYSWDATTKKCRRQFFGRDCNTVDCSKSNGIWAYYGANRQYYAYCYKINDKNEIAVFKCSEGAEFDGFTCTYKCRNEGKFPDTLNKSKYFECFYSGLFLTSRVKVCSTGTAFNVKTGFCE